MNAGGARAHTAHKSKAALGYNCLLGLALLSSSRLAKLTQCCRLCSSQIDNFHIKRRVYFFFSLKLTTKDFISRRGGDFPADPFNALALRKGALA